MTFIVNIIIIVIGTITAVISIMGGTWDIKSKKFTKIGWLAISGFVIFTILNIYKEILTVKERDAQIQTQANKIYAKEASSLIAKLPTSNMEVLITLNHKNIISNITSYGYANSSIRIDLEGRRNEVELFKFVVIPFSARQIPDYLLASIDFPNIEKEIIKRKSDDYYNKYKWIMFYKNGGVVEEKMIKEFGEMILPTEIRFAVNDDALKALPSTIEGMIGKEMKVIEDCNYYGIASNVSGINFYHNNWALYPFLSLSETLSDRVGVGHYQVSWRPNDIFSHEMNRMYISPSFLFNLKSLEKTILDSFNEREFE